MKSYAKKYNQKGFSVVEVILAAALFMILATGSVAVILQGLDSNRLGEEQTVATQYASEGIEATRSIKNQNFASLVNSAGTGISRVGTVWTFSGSNNTLSSKYIRVLTVSDVQRDGSGNIVASGGTLDPLTKKVTSTVSWNFTPTRSNSVVLNTYLTNWKKAIVGNWAIPALDSSLDLTIANSGANAANGLSLALSGNYIYLGRANSAGTELFSLDVSNTASPTLCANCQRELGGDVNDIVINGNYAYIASTNNSQELQIINISSPTLLSTAALTSFNLTAGNSGNANADAIALGISGSNLYMIRNGGNEFIKFDISTPSSPTLIGTNAGLTGTPTGMVIVGNYALVTSDDNAAEVQVINLTTLARDAVFDLNSGNNPANAISITNAGGNRILVGRVSSGAPELYSIDISNPTSLVLKSTFEIGADVISISYGNNLIFLGTSEATNDFLVLNGANLDSLPALPAFGSLNIATAPREVLYDTGMDRVFTADANSSSEFLIIKPQ